MLVASTDNESGLSDADPSDVVGESICEPKTAGVVSELVAIENPEEPTLGPFETFAIVTITTSPAAMSIGSLIVSEVADPECQAALPELSVVWSKTTQSAPEDPHVPVVFSPNDPPVGNETVSVPPELGRAVVAVNRKTKALCVAPTDNESGANDAPVTEDATAGGENTRAVGKAKHKASSRSLSRRQWPETAVERGTKGSSN